MIINCKYCQGTGRFPNNNPFEALFNRQAQPCPACRGAGELVIVGNAEDYVICKLCAGYGFVGNALNTFFTGEKPVCSACKGAGLLRRPVLGAESVSPPTASYGQAPRPSAFEYDVALSFAGEDRGTVESYSKILSTKGIRFFLDSDMEAQLWGSDLYVKLDEIYRLKAMYCVMFISQHYAAKRWTSHERKSAQARAFKENREYILPVRLDDTEIPGVPETVGYIDLRKTSIEHLAELTQEKVRQEKERISPPNSGTSGSLKT